jgi:hypothetical protein
LKTQVKRGIFCKQRDDFAASGIFGSEAGRGVFLVEPQGTRAIPAIDKRIKVNI